MKENDKYDKQDDIRVKYFLKRAQNILGIELEGEAKTAENMLKMTELIIEVAKMLQIQRNNFPHN